MQVYLAKAPSTAATFDGSGTVWTKVYSSGLLDASAQTWATDVVRTFFLFARGLFRCIGYSIYDYPLFAFFSGPRLG